MDHYFLQFNKKKDSIHVPTTDEPISASEELVKEDIRKLNENAEEIKELKEQIEKSSEQKSSKEK